MADQDFPVQPPLENMRIKVTVSISNPSEVVISIMIHWKDGPGNCNAEAILGNDILSLIEAILHSD